MRICLLLSMILVATLIEAQNHKKYYSGNDCAVPSLEEVGTIIKGKKEGHWKYYYWCLKEGDVVREEGDYVNDVKTGVWKYYGPHKPLDLDGVLGWDYSKVTFVNGLEQGEKISYYKGGKIYQKSLYKDGKLIGERIEYLQNGSVIKSENFDTGEIKEFWSNGKLKEHGFYDKNNWLHRKGEWKEYHENGSLKAVGDYADLQKIGPWKEYYDNGQIKARGGIKEYQRVGRWELFHKNGKPAATGEYKKDGYPRPGTWVTYDDKGQKDGVNVPEPYELSIMRFCNSVDTQQPDEDENSNYNYMFEKYMAEMAGVDAASDQPETVKKKVQVWWDRYHDACKCGRIDFIVWNGNILKYAIQTNFESFIYTVAKEYKLNLNYIDPVDGKTSLDFAVEEYEKFKKNNPTHSRLKRMENVIKLLKDNGAKRLKEL